MMMLCPSGSVAVRIETAVQEHIITCTDLTLSRATVLFHENESSRAYGSGTLLFLSTILLEQSGSELALCAQQLPQVISASGQSKARRRALMPRHSGWKTKRAAGQSTQLHFTQTCLVDWVCLAAFRSQTSRQGVGRCLLRLSKRSCSSQESPGHHGHELAVYQQKRQCGCSTSRKLLASSVNSFLSRMRSRRARTTQQ